jgi:hypothetical protein
MAVRRPRERGDPYAVTVMIAQGVNGLVGKCRQNITVGGYGSPRSKLCENF